MTARDGPPNAPRTQTRAVAGKPGVPKLTVAALALLVAGLGVVSSLGRTSLGRTSLGRTSLGRQSLARSARRLPPPVPARDVDLERYAGLWYEFARYDSWFERNCEGVTAEYSRRPDGLIRVVNVARKGRPDGPLRWAEAKARVIPETGNTKLKVAFFGPFFIGNYWVLDHDEDYAWSIVGEASRRYFWILTRDPVPAAAIQTMLLARARALGYDTAILHLTRQPPG
jgi:apolipoprotein D and lipocalin family protein